MIPCLLLLCFEWAVGFTCPETMVDLFQISNNFSMKQIHVVTNQPSYFGLQEKKCLLTQQDYFHNIMINMSDPELKNVLKSENSIVFLPNVETATEFSAKFTSRTDVTKKVCLIVAKSSVLDHLQEKINISVNQKVFYFDYKKVYETYTINNISIRNILGERNDNSSMSWVHDSFLKRRSNFHGQNIKYIVRNLSPWIKFDTASQADKSYTELKGPSLYELDPDTKFQGIFYDIVKAINNELNVTTTMYARTDNSCGNRLKNGTWIGVMSSIVNEEVDVGIASLSQRF